MKDGKKVVLIVEDHKDTLKFLVRLFINDGWIVRSSYSGEEALRKFNDEVDLAVVDVGLPTMNGFSVGALIKARSPGVMVYGITGNTDVPRDALRDSFDGASYKPFRARDLMSSIHRVMKMFFKYSSTEKIVIPF